MAEIPGWAYILIGGVVSGFSKFVQVQSGKVMTFFIYVGFAFIAIGSGKLLIAALFKKNKQQTAARQLHAQHQQGYRQANNARQPTMQQFQQHHTHPMRQQYQTQPGPPDVNFGQTRHSPRNSNMQNTQRAHHHAMQNTHHIKQVHAQGGLEHPSVISCPACGVRHYSYANFCMMCGSVMKKH